MLSNKKGEEAASNLWSYGILCSQVTVMHDGALLSWRWINICLPMESRK